jgi:DNA-binding MarR family transcriptional regulator
MDINEAIKSRFKNEKHKASVNLLFTAYWFKDKLVTALRAHDLSLEQHNVMRILRGSHPEGMRVKDILSRMVEKSSNVPRIIDKLAEKKLAVRVVPAHDKRETHCTLTPKGIRAIDDARITIDKITEEELLINETEAAALNALLEKMRG